MLKAVAALIINIINIYCVNGYSMKKIRRFFAFVLTVSVFTATACISNMGGKKSTADEIEGYLDTIVSYLTEKGCGVILFNAHPQDFKKTNDGIRTALNEKIPAIAEKYGAKFFDFSALLSTEAEPEKAVYGGHPNGEGGTVVADAFVKQFGSMFE